MLNFSSTPARGVVWKWSDAKLTKRTSPHFSQGAEESVWRKPYSLERQGRGRKPSAGQGVKRSLTPQSPTNELERGEGVAVASPFA